MNNSFLGRYAYPCIALFLSLSLLLASASAVHAKPSTSELDPHSYARADEVRVKHVSLDLEVDFDERKLVGSAVLELQRILPKARTLWLDTRALDIKEIYAGDLMLEYSLYEENSFLGSALEVDLPEDVDSIRIKYETSPHASGLQWLTPEQTDGGKFPFLFSQAQAIHARSFIPLQDTPYVRVTYDAKLKVPPGMLAVMSAANEPAPREDGKFHFTMPQPIPAYLIALAVGDLKFKSMSERTAVYAEAGILDAAAAEFEDTEKMLQATEALYGEYSWERYDLLILPSSFPFGGMENPRLSFITPTVIAGDKSLVALIAHELAHSWSGNTVTNASWRDLWLNEGFTTYLTYRIMEIIYGTERYQVEMALGYRDLLATIEAKAEGDEILAIDLAGRDPDDVFSNIPYEKGALFLHEIEQKVGRQNFDAFLLNYFEQFAFSSITTDTFIAHLDKTLLKNYADELDRERILEWIFHAGIPQGAPTPFTPVFAQVDEQREDWLANDLAAKDINTEKWGVHEWLYFLNEMPDQLAIEQIQTLDQQFDLTASTNNEIAHSWLLIAIRNNYKVAYPRLRDYLMRIGRNKLVSPLYEELAKSEEGKIFAREVFEAARSGYHPLTVKANQDYVQ